MHVHVACACACHMCMHTQALDQIDGIMHMLTWTWTYRTWTWDMDMDMDMDMLQQGEYSYHGTKYW